MQKKKYNRKYKDSVFRKLFSNPDTLLELYNALNGSNYTDPGELEINTLDNAIYLSMKNDVSFIFNNELCLYEHQSTVNPNLPFRNLMYVADILRKKYYDKSIYSPVLIKLPSPRFVVFYNGTEDIPEQHILYLSDSYESKLGNYTDTDIGFGTGAEAATDMDIRTNSDTYLDLKVLVINLNGCYNDSIKRNCRTLADYQTYVSLIREYTKNLSIEDAVERAIDECIKRGVLKEFLEKERAEIMSLSIYEFDKEREFRIVRADVMKLGREEGKRDAHISDIMDLLSEYGNVPENIRSKISSEKNIDKLKTWHRLAARTDSIESFESQM